MAFLQGGAKWHADEWGGGTEKGWENCAWRDPLLIRYTAAKVRTPPAKTRGVSGCFTSEERDTRGGSPSVKIWKVARHKSRKGRMIQRTHLGSRQEVGEEESYSYSRPDLEQACVPLGR